MYLYRTSRPAIHQVLLIGESGGIIFEKSKGRPGYPQLCFIRIDGSIFFGAVDHIQSGLLQIDEHNPQKKSCSLPDVVLIL